MLKITSSGSNSSLLKEFWSYRRVLFIFIKRDIIARYKQTLFGVIWAFLRPLLTFMMFNIIFYKMTHYGTYSSMGGNISKAFLLCGLLVWALFSGFINDAISRLQGNTSLAQKIYFPRLYIPFSSIGYLALDYFIGSFLLILVALFYHVSFSWLVLVTGIFLVFCLTIFQATGIALLVSSLNLIYRDIGFMIPFLMQIGFFMSPVLFPVDLLVKHDYIFWYSFIPTLAPIFLFKWIFGYTNNINPLMNILPSISLGVVLFLIGIYIFQKITYYIGEI